MKIKKLFLLAGISFFAFTSCNKKDDDNTNTSKESIIESTNTEDETESTSDTTNKDETETEDTIIELTENELLEIAKGFKVINYEVVEGVDVFKSGEDVLYNEFKGYKDDKWIIEDDNTFKYIDKCETVTDTITFFKFLMTEPNTKSNIKYYKINDVYKIVLEGTGEDYIQIYKATFDSNGYLNNFFERFSDTSSERFYEYDVTYNLSFFKDYETDGKDTFTTYYNEVKRITDYSKVNISINNGTNINEISIEKDVIWPNEFYNTLLFIKDIFDSDNLSNLLNNDAITINKTYFGYDIYNFSIFKLLSYDENGYIKKFVTGNDEESVTYSFEFIKEEKAYPAYDFNQIKEEIKTNRKLYYPYYEQYTFDYLTNETNKINKGEAPLDSILLLENVLDSIKIYPDNSVHLIKNKYGSYDLIYERKFRKVIYMFDSNYYVYKVIEMEADETELQYSYNKEGIITYYDNENKIISNNEDAIINELNLNELNDIIKDIEMPKYNSIKIIDGNYTDYNYLFYNDNNCNPIIDDANFDNFITSNLKDFISFYSNGINKIYETNKYYRIDELNTIYYFDKDNLYLSKLEDVKTKEITYYEFSNDNKFSKIGYSDIENTINNASFTYDKFSITEYTFDTDISELAILKFYHYKKSNNSYICDKSNKIYYENNLIISYNENNDYYIINNCIYGIEFKDNESIIKKYDLITGIILYESHAIYDDNNKLINVTESEFYY